jgi:hypothetical protein
MPTIRKRNWFLRRIVLGFAVAALAAPAAAQARIDESGVVGPNKSVASEPTNVYELSRVIRDAPKGPSSWSGVVWSPSTEVVSADGFGWDDAGIGAGIALGLLLLGGVAFRVISQRGKTQIA